MFRRILSALALLLGAVAIYHFVFIPYRCNREERLLQDATIAALNQRQGVAAVTARENLDDVERSLDACPRVPNFYMIAAANYRILKRHEEAERMYKTALNLERRPEIYFQLGLTQTDLQRNDEAVENFVKACRFVPVLLEEVPYHVRELVRARL